jgi:DMSO/TMAO reductase YedYZ molybdopterin-dependent catalytic subunit/thiosulfate reductase cytochrome b subunit
VRQPRHAVFVRLTHWVAACATLGLIVSGVAILVAHPRLYWGETGAIGTPALIDLPIPFVFGHSGWGRYLHFLAAWVSVASGAVYVLAGIWSGHFRRKLVPSRHDFTWAHVGRVASDHLRFKPSARSEADSYNVLQRLAYLAVVFLLGPLVLLSGLAFSPALASVFPGLVSIFGGQQSARTIHLVLGVVVVFFIVVHLVMVWIAGFRARVGAMIRSRVASSSEQPVGQTISRRRLLVSGVTAAAGATGLAGTIRLLDQYKLIPPDYHGLYGAGETLTYASQRLLMARQSLAREFSRSDISRVVPVNGPPPEHPVYQRLMADQFRDWRLTVDGLVGQPSSFSLADLKGYPSRTQITHQACEEGWSFIAEWTGVRLSYVLDLVGVDPRARYVVFFPFDDFWESIDMADALHPQTYLAYRMNGQDLPAPHGAPVRLRVARQLGYKSIKYLSRITVTDTLQRFGDGLGGVNPEYGYSWWAGI